VQLTPTERDRLLLFLAAELARSRRARGLRLNVPEATAIVADTVAEVARDGGRLADAIAAGRHVLAPEELLPGVSAIVTEVKVEAVFDDGTRLAVVTEPFGPVPDGPHSDGPQPGSVWGDEPVESGTTADASQVTVTNTATVPISVSSHFHFFEINPRLRFDRRAAYGKHLAVAAGTVQRFDPGTTSEVNLVPIGGARVVIGFAGLVDGPLDEPGALDQALERAAATGYLGAEPHLSAEPQVGRS
jgi:urease subunit gamma/beta